MGLFVLAISFPEASRRRRQTNRVYYFIRILVVQRYLVETILYDVFKTKNKYRFTAEIKLDEKNLIIP